LHDYVVQRFVCSAQLFDLVEGMKHGGMVPAAKLPTDFLQRCPVACLAMYMAS
jgi:hypothetical protein